MPRMEVAPTEVVASFEVLPKGTYELTIGEGKAFMRQNRHGKDSFGVRYLLVVAEGPKKNAKVPVSLYQQSEGAQAMSKQFIMAVLGFGNKQEEEERFNNAYRGADWSFDTDTGHLGSVWKELEGQRVLCDMGVQFSKELDADQNTYKWRPISSLAGAKR